VSRTGPNMIAYYNKHKEMVSEVILLEEICMSKSALGDLLGE
jgi:hypothetical protein